MNSFTSEFLSLLLGPTSLAMYAAGMIIGFLGAFTGLLIRYKNRDKDNYFNPKSFSMRFLILDNLIRLIKCFVVFFIYFRFGSEFFGIGFTMGSALIIGLCLEQAIGGLKHLKLNFKIGGRS